MVQAHVRIDGCDRRVVEITITEDGGWKAGMVACQSGIRK